MRAELLPRFLPAQAAGVKDALWYALLIAVLLLAVAGLLAIDVLHGPPAEPQLLAPFRWLNARTLA